MKSKKLSFGYLLTFIVNAAVLVCISISICNYGNVQTDADCGDYSVRSLGAILLVMILRGIWFQGHRTIWKYNKKYYRWFSVMSLSTIMLAGTYFTILFVRASKMAEMYSKPAGYGTALLIAVLFCAVIGFAKEDSKKLSVEIL
jgi:cytochrome bd-type quinol oxidase subunit 2